MKKFLVLVLALLTVQTYADCIGSCFMPKLDLESSLGNANELMQQTRLISDSRKIYSHSSPDFLESYGKLILVDRHGNRIAHCTGNLVTRDWSSEDPQTKENDVVTTAEHCFSSEVDINRSYILFVNKQGEKFKRHFSIAKKSENLDYAILKLDRPLSVSDITPIVVGYIDYRNIYSDDIYKKRVSFTLGGYSADSYKGKRGKRLTYDQDCEALYADNMKILTNCSAYHGASGGALVIEARDSEGNVKPYLMGVSKGGYNRRTDNILVSSVNLMQLDGEKLDDIVGNSDPALNINADEW